MSRVKRTTRRRSVLLRLALLCFSIYSMIQLTQLQIQLVKQRKTLENEQIKLHQQEIKNRELAALLANGTDKDLIERAARDKLDYIYGDEEVYSGQ